MAELEIQRYKEFDPHRWGAPFVGIVLPNGKVNYTKAIIEYTGDAEKGTEGSLIVKNADKNVTYVTGQKNLVSSEVKKSYYTCTGDGFEKTTPKAVQKKIDQYLAAISSEINKSDVEKQLEGFKKFNEIVVLKEIGQYNTEQMSKPWIAELTKEGFNFDKDDQMEALPIGRVIGNPGEYMQAFVVNPKRDQVFALGQKDLISQKLKLEFFEVSENGVAQKLSRQEANKKLGIEGIQPFTVKDERKIIRDMPNGYNADLYSMWVAQEIRTSDNKIVYQSKDDNGNYIGNYSGGRDGQPGQFYVKNPENNAVYAVFQKDYNLQRSKIICKVRHENGKMVELPLISPENEAKRKVIKSFQGFDEERFDDPKVRQVTGEGKMRAVIEAEDGGRSFIGGYSGQPGLGQEGYAYANDPHEGEAFAVYQFDKKFLRTTGQFFVYEKGNFLEVDKETAIEHAKEYETLQEKDAASAANDKNEIAAMKEKVGKGEALSGGEVRRMETYRQKFTKQKESLGRVAEGGETVIARIPAWDAGELKSPYLNRLNGNGRFVRILGTKSAEFIGSAEKGGRIVVHDAKEKDVYTFGQGRQDGVRTPAQFAVFEEGKVVPMDSGQYQAYKNKQKQLKTAAAEKSPENKQITLTDAKRNLAAQGGLTAADAQKALLKLNIKEFTGKTAAQKNQLAGKAAAEIAAKGKEQSRGRD